jgi:alpha-glucosidase
MPGFRAAVLLVAFASATASATSLMPSVEISSPDGRIVATVDVQGGMPGYSVKLDGKPVLHRSKLGVIRDDADFTANITPRASYSARVAKLEKIEDRYELLTSKRRLTTYRAHRRVLEFAAANGAPMDVVFQVSNDGIAFRYVFPGSGDAKRRISSEATSFNFLADTRGWLQPIAPARSGWSESNPSYEELYERDFIVGTPSPLGRGYVFPALFRSGDTWLLVSEASVGPNYCGSRLLAHRRQSEYTLEFPTELENSGTGPATPEAKLPWTTPWRLIAIGSLKTIVESTLGTDVADPPAPGTRPPTHGPGRSSWSWPLLGDAHTVFDTQKKFVDYAADMHWEYTLVDAEWDRQIGYEKLQELVNYARPKGVSILVWYNSGGDWTRAPQTPRDRMFDPATRRAEFQRLQKIGVAGVKIDFFAGDAQSTMAYYHELIQDAARAGLSVNFHGATLPRGWQRTYPNLLTTEAVRGFEFITFDQKNAEDEPWHAAMLPFTRNVFDPMDFTPLSLGRVHDIQRRTTVGFELATTALFTSGIQHFAEIPDTLAKAPEYVRTWLRRLPVVWDEVRFIDGFPGKYVVLARRAGKSWYVSGINGENTPRDLKLGLGELAGPTSGQLIGDGGDALGFRSEQLAITARPVELRIPARGGFVITIN